jgi:hypothetical protein
MVSKALHASVNNLETSLGKALYASGIVGGINLLARGINWIAGAFDNHPNFARAMDGLLMFGLAAATPDDLRGGGPAENAEVVRRVLAGDDGPHRDIVVLNAGAALVVAGVVDHLGDGIDVARAAIDDGRAASALAAMVATSQATAVNDSAS